MIAPLSSSLRKAWLRACQPLLREFHLDAAGISVPVHLDRSQLLDYWLPLANLICCAPAKQPRRLVGIVGEPGSGKSVLGLLLRQIITRRPREKGAWRVATISIDGFHHPNSYLDSHTHRREDGREVSLRQIKGTPWTYDVAALKEALRRLAGGAEAVKLPEYSRRLHEPVADAITIEPNVELILVEGNWLLHAEPPWHQIAAYLDLSVYLEAPPRVVRRSLIGRHLAGGKRWQQCRDIYRAADRPNARRVRASRGCADLIVKMDEHRRIFELNDQQQSPSSPKP